MKETVVSRNRPNNSNGEGGADQASMSGYPSVDLINVDYFGRVAWSDRVINVVENAGAGVSVCSRIIDSGQQAHFIEFRRAPRENLHDTIIHFSSRDATLSGSRAGADEIAPAMPAIACFSRIRHLSIQIHGSVSSASSKPR